MIGNGTGMSPALMLALRQAGMGGGGGLPQGMGGMPPAAMLAAQGGNMAPKFGVTAPPGGPAMGPQPNIPMGAGQAGLGQSPFAGISGMGGMGSLLNPQAAQGGAANPAAGGAAPQTGAIQQMLGQTGAQAQNPILNQLFQKLMASRMFGSGGFMGGAGGIPGGAGGNGGFGMQGAP